MYDADVIRSLRSASSLSSPAALQYLSEEVVVNIVCDKLNIQKSSLFGLSKNHVISKQRMLLAKYLLEYAGRNITSVSKSFQRTHGTFSRQLKKFNERPEKYFPIDTLKKIELSLTESMLGV